MPDSAQVEVGGLQYETVDVNIVPDLYVTWIVDLWEGNRNDPATSITRYIGVWRAGDLEDEDGSAKDPEFTGDLGRYGYSADRYIKPSPLHWDKLEITKEADRESRNYKDATETYMNAVSYSYGSESKRKSLYQRFMLAIEILGRDPENQEAWNTVEEWREYDANRHEK